MRPLSSNPDPLGDLARGGLPSFGACLILPDPYKPLGHCERGPPFHGSRSSREIKLQNASCQMGGHEVAGI